MTHQKEKTIKFGGNKYFTYLCNLKYKKTLFYKNLNIPANAVQLEVIEEVSADILKKLGYAHGHLPLMPVGSITWAYEKHFERDTDFVFPEGNKYSANVPKKFFKIIDKDNMKKNTPLINGQWYKQSPVIINSIQAIKFKKWDDDYNYCPLFHEIIINGEVKKDYNSGGIWNDDFGKSLVECSLNEIEKYLPDNHPDKPIKKEIGLWYKNSDWNSPYDFAKAIRFTHNEIYFDEKIYDREYFNTRGAWGVKSFDKLIVALPHEYSSFLPDGHPDKIKNSAHILTIKAGDTVRCIGQSSLGQLGTSAGWKKDLEFVVTRVDEYDGYNVYFGGLGLAGVYSDQVELIKNKIKINLVKGQFIEAVYDAPNGGFVEAGEIGVVKEINTDSISVDFPSHSDYWIPSASLNNLKYKIHPIGTDAVELKPRINQYIKALIDSPDGGLVKKGEIGLITSIGSHDIRVSFPSNSTYLISTKIQSYYKLMPVGWKPSDSDNAYGYRGSFKKGGWVKCIAEAKTNKFSPENQFKFGEYYQISEIYDNWVKTVEGFILMFKNYGAYCVECEWYGMVPPNGYKAKLNVVDTSGSISSERPILGQYIKALEDSPEGGDVLKGEIGEITYISDEVLTANFPRRGSYGIFYRKYLGLKYELMPIGWKPSIISDTPTNKKGFQKNGWVKCIAEAKSSKHLRHNQFKLGEYYQVNDVFAQYVETVEGYKLNHVKTHDYDIECEWVGMDKPTIFLHLEKNRYTPDGVGELKISNPVKKMDTFIDFIEEPWTQLKTKKESSKIIN